jgi:hypothetical protein
MGHSESGDDEDDVKLTLLPRQEPESFREEGADIASDQNLYFTALLSIFMILLLCLFGLATEFDPSVKTAKSEMDNMYIYYQQVKHPQEAKTTMQCNALALEKTTKWLRA